MSAININKSLFVPHVFPNFSQKYVADAFADLGVVDRVDFVAKQDRDGKPYNAAYIHFKSLYENAIVERIQDEIYDNGSYHFYHDESEYYWIVLPNTAKKHVPGERKPRLDLGEAKVINSKTPEKTPVKAAQKPVCPGAPKKQTYANKANFETKSYNKLNLLDEFDVEASEETIEMAEIEAEMAEIEAELEAEDENLVSIDYRYIQTIEDENFWLHGEIAQLRMALINLDQMYQAEKAKVRAFSSVETSVDL